MLRAFHRERVKAERQGSGEGAQNYQPGYPLWASLDVEWASPQSLAGAVGLRWGSDEV